MVTKKKTTKKKISKKPAKRKAVRKKSVKKVSRKKPVKKSSGSTKGSPVSRKDFEAFQFGVQRLKELEKELNSMDTRGFSKEAQVIRSKLKNVSEIPNIERAMKTLKLKIRNKYHPKRKRKSPTKEISEDIEDIKGTIQGLKRSRKESFEDIKDELEKLSKKKKAQVPIDSKVDVLIDTNFNSFLDQTKRALSARVKSKEDEIDNTLKVDLEKREQIFDKKRENLQNEFERHQRKLEEDMNRKYEMKIKTSLKKEVAENFNRKLKQKLNAEKVELGKTYKEQLKEHAETELEKQKNELKDALEKSKQHMHEKLMREFNKKLHEELDKKEKILRKGLADEYDLKLKKKIEEHEQEIKKRKFDLELEMQRKIKQVLK